MPPRGIPEAGPSGFSSTIHLLRRLIAFAIITGACVALFSRSNGPTGGSFQYHPISFIALFLVALPEVMYTVAKMKRQNRGTPKERETLIKTHQLATMFFQMVALLGFGAVEYTKISNGYPHLTTPHGVVGTLCGLSIFVQVILGMTLRYVLSATSSSRQKVKNLHGMCAVASFITGYLCFFGGLMFTDYAEDMLPAALIYFTCAASPILVMCAYFA